MRRALSHDQEAHLAPDLRVELVQDTEGSATLGEVLMDDGYLVSVIDEENLQDTLIRGFQAIPTLFGPKSAQ